MERDIETRNRTMGGLLQHLAARLLKRGIPPRAAAIYIKGVLDLLGPDPGAAEQSIADLRGLASDDPLWEVIHRRHIFQPLIQLTSICASLSWPTILTQLEEPEEQTWFAGLVKVLGKDRTAAILQSLRTRHIRNAGKSRHYAFFLLRHGAHWMDVQTVRRQVQGVLGRIQTGKATREERADWDLLTEPLLVKGSTRTRKTRGQRSKHPVDTYICERQGDTTLEDLIEEVRLVFGDEGRTAENVGRQLRDFRRIHPDQRLSSSRWNRDVTRPCRQISRIDARLSRSGLDRNLRRRLRRRRARLLEQVQSTLARRWIGFTPDERSPAATE